MATSRFPVDSITIACVLVLSLLGGAHSQLTILQNSDQLSITFQDVELFVHTSNTTVLSVGVGEASFLEQHGSFTINDTLLSLLHLDLYEVIVDTADVVAVNFTATEATNAMMTLLLTSSTGSNGFPELTLQVTCADSADAAGSCVAYNRLVVRLAASAEEKVFGAGEQFSYFNLRGHSFPIWTSEQGVGRDNGYIANISNLDGGAGGDYYTTYWPQASFISSKHYSLLVYNYNYQVLDFSLPDRHEWYAHDTQFRARLVWAPTLLSVVQGVAITMGTQPPLPEWTMTGAILAVQKGTQQMLNLYNEAKDAGVNVSAMWIQDWSGKIETSFGYRVYWNWRWNQTYYPGLDVAIKELGNEGVRVLAYINPYLIEGSEMFLEAASLGHLMMSATDIPYTQNFGGFMAGTVDVLSQESRNWYRDEITKNMLGLGLAGWMADFGEYTTMDAMSKNTSLTSQQIHNLMPYTWALTNREALEAANQLGEAVFWMRSGCLGSSGHQLLAWAGDQNVDFSIADGVASTIRAALSLAMSGMGVYHFDIGGYTTQPPALKRSKELLLRSAEYAVFTPVMRTHEGNKPEANHQINTDADTMMQFARLTQIHAFLLPYTRTLVHENYLNGTPVMRALFLHYEGDSGSWQVEDQYLYGPDLLVAPVIHKGQDTVPMHLPPGEWASLWTTQGVGVVQGPLDVIVAAPMGHPAVYYRIDSPWVPLFVDIGTQFTQTAGAGEIIQIL